MIRIKVTEYRTGKPIFELAVEDEKQYEDYQPEIPQSVVEQYGLPKSKWDSVMELTDWIHFDGPEWYVDEGTYSY